MLVALGVTTVVLFLVVVVLGARYAELVAAHNEAREQLGTVQRDHKRLQGQLEEQAQKYSQKAQAASMGESSAKGHKQRNAQLATEVQGLKAELKKVEETRHELAGELNRVRIDREETRQELVAARARLKELGQTAAELEALKAAASAQAAAPAPAPKPEPAPETERSSGGEAAREAKAAAARLERELAKSTESVDRLEKRLERLKREVVAREFELRKAAQQAEHNRRAYIVTQLQLDLVNDELFVLKHGEPAAFKMADKAAKRQALRPNQPAITLLDMPTIDRTGLGADLADIGRQDDVDVEREEAALARAEAAPAPKAAPAPEPVVEAAPAATPTPAPKAEAAEAAQVATVADDSTIRLRKATRGDEPSAVAPAEGDLGVGPRPGAPPRPAAGASAERRSAPPRPAGK